MSYVAGLFGWRSRGRAQPLMKPLFHPELVNGVFGDPVLYVDCLFQHRALLFDLGEVNALAPRKVLRVSDAFISHTHMDHFMGFDRVLRLCLGRDKALHLFGPPGFVEQVAHKLAAYTWNLVENYETDFRITATEVGEGGYAKSARFRCRDAFRCESAEVPLPGDGVLVDEEGFRVRHAVLDHKTPCLGFALEEKVHVNVWKNRLEEMGLPVGPWLHDLKQAVVRGEPENTPVRVWWSEGDAVRERHLRLGDLMGKILRIVPGQKIGYIVDVVYSEDNARRIRDLVEGADVLFIEATFLEQDAQHAAEKYHLTAKQAGTLARLAGVKRFIPFHFSTRYSEEGDRVTTEANLFFRSGSDEAATRIA